MKMSKMFLEVALVVGLFAGVSFAGAGQWSNENAVAPTICKSGTTSTVTVATTAGVTAVAFNANAARCAGMVLNNTTGYVYCSFTSTIAATIDGAYFLLYPTGDSYQRDRLFLNQVGVVYQGPMYFEDKDVTGAKGYGSITYYEWK
jgi:hypothetical protein